MVNLVTSVECKDTSFIWLVVREDLLIAVLCHAVPLLTMAEFLTEIKRLCSEKIFFQ